MAATSRMAAPRQSAPSRSRASRNGLRATLRLGLDVALPPLCPACRDLVADNGLCPPCWSKLAFIARALLPAARHSVRLRSRPRHPVDAGDRRSARLPARARRGALRRRRRARSCTRSSTATGSTLRPLLGRWMARAGHELFDGADALVPVPLHWRRLWARRFNQSAALAQAISRASGDPGDARRRSAASRRPRSRSGCRAPSAPPMCRARSVSIPPARPRSRGAA